MADGWATVLVAVAMAIGMAGTIVPVLPGLTVLWAAALVYGLIVGFGAIGTAVMVALTIVLGISIAKSVLLPRRMAQANEVATWSQLLAAVGAIIGFFVVPVVGVIIGALIGLFVAEYINQRAFRPAWNGTKVVAKAFGLGVLIDIALGLVMFTLWAGWALTVIW